VVLAEPIDSRGDISYVVYVCSMQVILESFASPRSIIASLIHAEMEPHVFLASVDSPASVQKVRHDSLLHECFSFFPHYILKSFDKLCTLNF
jgi:hypothetical protein